MVNVEKNTKVFFVHFVLAIAQFFSILFVIVLEYLSTEKMGVARYLVYKKQVFDTTIFAPMYVNLYYFFFVAGGLICLFLLLNKDKRVGKIVSIVVAIIANIIGVIFLQSMTELNAYHFFLIGIMIVIVIEYSRLLFIYFIKRKL